MRSCNRLWIRAVVGVGSVLLLITSAPAKTPPKTHHTVKPAASSPSAAKNKKSAKHSSKSKKTKKAAASRYRGQRGIDKDRAAEIQAAPIREHYLTGEPTGVWDQRSKDAMARYQSDNGWQTKVLPDSRALIKLGLGPDHTNLINPATAMTTRPAVAATDQRQ